MCLFFLLVLSSLHSGLFHILYFFNKVLQNMSQLYWQKYYTNSCKKKKKKMFSVQKGCEDCRISSRLLYFYFAILIYDFTRQVLSSSQNWLRKSLCYWDRLSGDDGYCCESLPDTHWAGKRCSGPQSPGVRNQVIQAIVGFFLMCINAISLY